MAALQLAGHLLTRSPSASPRASRRPLTVHATERRAGHRGSGGANSCSSVSGVASTAGGVDTGAGAAIALPSGAVWYLHLHSRTTPTYGSNFVLQRPTVGGPGLVRSSRPPAPVRAAASPPPMPPTVWHAPGSDAGLGLALAGISAGTVVVDTEFTVLPPRSLPGDGGAAPGSIAPNTTCTGMVWQRSVEEEPADGASAAHARRRRSSGRHPRRTQMVGGKPGHVSSADVCGRMWVVPCAGSTPGARPSLELLTGRALSSSAAPPTAALHMQPVRRGERLRGEPARLGQGLRLCPLRGGLGGGTQRCGEG